MSWSDLTNCAEKLFWHFSDGAADFLKVRGAYVGIAHAVKNSNCFGLPFCEECRGLRAAALQQILDTDQRWKSMILACWSPCWRWSFSYPDILQEQLVKGKVVLLGVRLDTVCHRCYDQLWCRHFVEHVESNTPYISLEGTQSIVRKKWLQFFIRTDKSKLGPSILFFFFNYI